MKKLKGLTRASCIRLGKEAIKKEINETLRKLPDGFYYYYDLEALDHEGMRKKEKEIWSIENKEG